MPKEKPKQTGKAARGAPSPRKRKGAIALALAHPKPTRVEVEEALRAVPNTHDWHGWVRIGAALFDALGDDGEELFAAWSARSPKDDPAATRAKWASFRSSPMTEVTAASLFWEARQNGWVPERERRAGRVDDADARADGDAGGDRANSVELTEDGVALAFARRRRDDLRYCHDAGAWFVWAGTRWRQNRDGLAFAGRASSCAA